METAGYDVSILVVSDPAVGANESDPISQAETRSGIAAASIAGDPVDAEAASSFVGGRDFRFTNTTDATISFNISGLFEAEMLASHDGAEGFARTSGSFQLLFDAGPDVEIVYFPIAP